MMTLGQNLKMARQNSGLTQKEVELKLGLRSLSLRDFETERIKLSADLALKFASLYHVSLDELIKGIPPLRDNTLQSAKLTQLEFLFSKGEFDVMMLDPVIRATLDEYPDKIFDHSVFELLCMNISEKQKRDVAAEIMKSIGSLLGVDHKITEAELTFFTKLSVRFGFNENTKIVTKSLSIKLLPDVSGFHHQPGLRHFLVWVLFFVSKSEGVMGSEELEYIQECAEALRIHKSHYLGIKKYFVREIH